MEYNSLEVFEPECLHNVTILVSHIFLHQRDTEGVSTAQQGDEFKINSD